MTPDRDTVRLVVPDSYVDFYLVWCRRWKNFDSILPLHLHPSFIAYGSLRRNSRRRNEPFGSTTEGSLTVNTTYTSFSYRVHPPLPLVSYETVLLLSPSLFSLPSYRSLTFRRSHWYHVSCFVTLRFN